MNFTTLHGGDLDAAERELGISRESIIDFSANINPLGAPDSVRRKIAESTDCVSAYPDKGYLKLRKAVSEYIGAETENILVGNGSTELIGLIIKAISPKNALILAPCYSEYEREVGLNGGKCSFYVLKEEEGFVPDCEDIIKALCGVDMLILCNPNNPTDSVMNACQIEEVVKACKKSGIFVMIDETYAEFSDKLGEITSIPLVEKYDNLAVIRGTSKFFACPGLRLGYGVISNSVLKDKIQGMRDLWSVGSLTAKAGEVMFSDEKHIKATQTLVFGERPRLKAELLKIKELKTYNLNSNLVLCRILKEGVTAADIFKYLLKYNIIIRSCDNIKALGSDYFRFCIMKSEQNDLLLKGIKEYFNI